MSFFCAFPYEDRIELLTDGASYTRSGRLVFTHEKVDRAPHIPMAVTGRGNSGFVRQMTRIIIEMSVGRTFGETMQALYERIEVWRQTHPPFAGASFQMLICGFDPAYGFRTLHLTDIDDLMWPGVRSMQLQDVAGIQYGGPTITDEQLKPIFTEERVVRGATAFGPEFCQLVRATPDYLTEDVVKGRKNLKKQYLVGGHIDHTIITAAGATTKRLLTWPDKRLRKIDPTLQPVLGFPSPANDIAVPANAAALAA